MKSSAPAPTSRALVTKRTVLPQSLIRKANAAARAEGMDLDSFISRAIARDNDSQPAIMLDADESRRLALLSGKMRTSPAKTVRAILLNALGYSHFVGNSHQYRVIDLANAMKWA